MFEHTRPAPFVHVIRWRGHRALRRVVASSVLILLGAGFLLRNQGLIGTNDLWLVAPLAVALSGIVRLVVAPGVGSLLRAAIRLAIAAYLVVVIEHIGGWTLAATWPVLLIAVGAGMVGYAMLGRRAFEGPDW